MDRGLRIRRWIVAVAVCYALASAEAASAEAAYGDIRSRLAAAVDRGSRRRRIAAGGGGGVGLLRHERKRKKDEGQILYISEDVMK